MVILNPNELKEVVEKVVLSQGNKFIKELLRRNDVKIGKNKTEFLINISAGIDEGKLDQEKIEFWLNEIEGWGNQHIYLFRPPELNKDELELSIKDSQFADILINPINYEFPEELSLQTIQISNEEVIFGWKEGNESWARVKSRDYIEDDGEEKYEFRAFRQKSERKLVRLVWKFNDPMCEVYITHANDREVHEGIFEIIWNDLKDAGFCLAPLARISLSNAFANLNEKPELKVNSVKMNAPGGHVTLVATAPQTGIHDIAPIRQAQQGIDENDFTSSDGVFHFNPDNLVGLSRKIKVEGSGTDSRIRLWAQCTRDDVNLLIHEVINSL